jgi:hypothetical protein
MNTSRGLIPFLVAIGAVVLLFWSFVSGISDALSGNGTGNVVWQIVFIVAALLIVAAIVLAIVNLAKKRLVVISIATLLVAAIPIFVIVFIAVSLSLPGN